MSDEILCGLNKALESLCLVIGSFFFDFFAPLPSPPPRSALFITFCLSLLHSVSFFLLLVLDLCFSFVPSPAPRFFFHPSLVRFPFLSYGHFALL